MSDGLNGDSEVEHPEIARRRARQAGIPFIRISAKTVRFRGSDILRFEQQCADTAVTSDQLARVEDMHCGLAKSRAAKEAK